MRRALLIGLNDYPSAPLRGCVRDATELATILEKNGDGSPNFSTKLLTEPPENLTKGVLKKEIKELFDGEVDVALLYFSGHGFVNSIGGYIVTTDHSSFDEGISMDEILIIANNSKAKDKIIILDCCHSGAFGSPMITGSHISQLGEGLTVLTASRKDQYAMEKSGQGVFTSLILDALQGGAADLRGHVTPGSLYAYVDEALGAWEQRPVFKTNVTRFTSLRKTVPPISVEILRNLIEYFDEPESYFDLDPSYEFTTEDAIDENVKVFKELQKLERVGLVVPVDEEHMYYAAMNNKSCRLTALGYQYWRLVKEGKI